MIRRRSIVAGTAALAAACVITAGCSQSGTSSSPASPTPTAVTATPNAGLTDSALRAAIKSAIAQGTAVHAKGSITQTSETFGMDLQLNRDNTSEGTIDLDNVSGITGVTVPVKVVGGTTYLQMTPSLIDYMAKQAGESPMVIQSLTGKWLSSATPVGKGMESAFADLLSYSNFLKMLGSDVTDTYHAAGTSTLNGQTGAYYTTAVGTKVYVAASGPAYVLRASNDEPNLKGTIDLTWNHPTTVTAPPSSEIFQGDMSQVMSQGR